MLLKHPEADRDNDLDEHPLILGGHEERAANAKSGGWDKLVLVVINIVTLLWISGAALYIEKNIGWPNLWNMLPHEIGSFIVGVFAPLAFVWLLLSSFKRRTDNKLQGNALDALMRELSYPSPEAEARVASLMQTLRKHAREVQVETEKASVKIEEATERLTAQNQEASGAVENLLNRADHFYGEMDQRAELVGKLIEQANLQKDKLDGIALEQASIFSKSVDDAESRSEAVCKTLATQIEALENAMSVAEDRSTKMTHQLEQTSQEIAAVALHTLNRAEAAGEGLTRQIHKLDETSEEIRERMDKGADQLSEKAREVETLSRSAAVELAKAGDVLVKNSSDLSLSSDDALSRLGTVRDSLSAGTSDVERAIDTLEGKQARFREEVEATGRETRYASGQLAADTGMLTVSIQEMNEEMTSASEKMRSEVEQLEQTFSKTEASLSDMEKVLNKGQSLLREAGEESLDHAGKLKAHMAAHAEDLLNNNEVVEKRTAEIQEQLRKQLNSLTSASKQIQDMSLEISARLEANVDTLSEASISTSNQIIQVGSGFQRQAVELKSAAEKISTQIIDASDDLRRETSDIEMNAERTAKSIKAVSEELEKKQRELGATADQSKVKLSAAVEETVRHHQEFLATAERATLQARQSGESAHSQTAELAKTAERASAELRAMGDQANTHLEELSHTVSKVNNEGNQLTIKARENMESLANVSQSASEKLTELSDISERAKDYAQTIEKILRQETSALSEVARLLADKAEAIESALSERSVLLERTQGQADLAGDAFRRKTVELAKASELMLTGLQYADQALGQHKKEMENTRQRIQNDLGNVVVHMTDAGQHAQGMSEAMAESLQKRAMDLIRFTEQAHSGSKNLMEQFDQQKKRLEVTTQHVENSIGETSKILKSESQNLREVAGLAAEEALITSVKFQKQADRLKEASQSVQKQSDKISSEEKAEAAESFRKSSSFIIDSLHSLTIDLARNFDNTLPEELWKRYRRGEKSIFTKRLLKNKDAEKIRNLYRDNGDFRRYADQYRSEFDRLVSETENAEFSGLLIETYASSDVGKVYVMLVEALDAGI